MEDMIENWRGRNAKFAMACSKYQMIHILRIDPTVSWEFTRYWQISINQMNRTGIRSYWGANWETATGWEIAATRDVRLIMVIIQMYIRNTQLHWRPIVVRLGPRVWVQCTRSGQHALNTIQLPRYGIYHVYVYMNVCIFLYYIQAKI